MKKSIFVAMCIFMASILLAGGAKESKSEQQTATGLRTDRLDTWPTKSLTIVITYKPGGSTGRHASAIAPYLSKVLGVPVHIEYREGGNTTVGYLTHINKDPDDGSFIVYGNFNAYCQNAIRGVYKYEDVVSLGMLVEGHRILAVNPKFDRFADFKDFLTKIKQNPNKYSTAASKGWGAVIEQIFSDNGYKFRAVPYSGSDERLAFYAGDIDFYLTDYENIASGGDAGTYRVLAIFAEKSPYDFPVVNKVLKEHGYNFTFPNMISPRLFQVKASFKNKYPGRFKMLSEAIRKAASDPDFLNEIKKSGDVFVFNPRLPEESDPVLDQFYKDLLKYKDIF